MNITIFNPAPVGDTLVKWGDYPFGRALQRSLEALGAEVTQRYWPQWKQDPEADVHLVLRGKRAFPQPHGRPAVLWMISHPASVSEVELSAYDFVLLGSKRHMAMLGDLVRAGEFDVARQCTEFTPAHPASGGSAEDRRGAIFVANSRGVRRPILRWALDLGLPVDIYGRNWKNFGLSQHVRSEHVENERLPALYRESRLALNDHWTDMRYFGYISNRLFDCLASGLPVVTDDFAELHEVFGDSLLYAHDRASFLESHRHYLGHYPAVAAGIDECWKRIGGDYTFDARARLIADIAERIRAGNRLRSPTAPREHDAGKLELQQLLGGDRNARILHVAPLHRLDFLGGLHASVDYVTAGPGCGPWTVEADDQMASFARRTFNAIIVDDAVGWELADAFDAEAFLRASQELLKPQGKLLVRADSSLVRAARPGWTANFLTKVSESYYRHSGGSAPAREDDGGSV